MEWREPGAHAHGPGELEKGKQEKWGESEVPKGG